MSDKKRIEQEPLYSCCQCYDEFSWPKKDLRWYKNDLWCANCFDELNEDGERMLWIELEVFTPKLEKEIAEARAEIATCHAESGTLYMQIADLRRIIDDTAEREAAFCPENVPFDEYIAALESKIERMKNCANCDHWQLLNCTCSHDQHHDCRGNNFKLWRPRE